jgi:hypothetical protein
MAKKRHKTAKPQQSLAADGPDDADGRGHFPDCREPSASFVPSAATAAAFIVILRIEIPRYRFAPTDPQNFCSGS